MPPLSLMIKPASGLCNMRCSYCFYSDVTSHREHASYGKMSEETLETLIRKACAYAQDEIHIAFQGGEPTLAGKDFFRKLLQLEKKYAGNRLKIHNSIQTNGYALDEEWMDVFQEGAFLVGVSLDGTRALHDHCRVDANQEPTYDRIVKNIHLLQKHEISFNILCVVNEPIAKQPREVFEALKAFQYLQFIACLDNFDGSKTAFSLNAQTYGRFLIETFDDYASAWREGKPVSIRLFDNWLSVLLGQRPECCSMMGICGLYYLMEADGSVYPCDFYVLDEWRMGNIQEDSFFRLAKSEIAEKFRTDSYHVSDECKDCAHHFLCRGGCKRDREPFSSGKPSLNRLCESYRMFFDARMPQMKQLAKEVWERNQSK